MPHLLLFIVWLAGYILLFRWLVSKRYFPGQGHWSARIQPGLLAGWAHGLFFVAVLVARFNDPRLMLYEPENQGFTYDFGMLAGMLTFAWLV